MRRIHLQLVDENRSFAACAPHLSVSAYRARGLTLHSQLVTCPRCKTLIVRAQRAIEAHAAERRP